MKTLKIISHRDNTFSITDGETTITYLTKKFEKPTNVNDAYTKNLFDAHQYAGLAERVSKNKYVCNTLVSDYDQ